MAFIICSDCKNEISDKVLECPKCGVTIGDRSSNFGKKIRHRKNIKKGYLIFLLIPIIIIVVFLFELVLFNQNFGFFK